MNNYTEITYIYALINPLEPNIIRYVGKSDKPRERIKTHIYECKKPKQNTYKNNWIKSLLAKNIKPEMVILKICPLIEYSKWEEHFIKLYKTDKLTNGDESGRGYIHFKETINKISIQLSNTVYQFDLNGNYLNEYKSARFASKQLNISHSQIIRCCNNLLNHASGFIFSYSKIKPNTVINNKAESKIVYEINSNNEIICEWSSIMECSRQTQIDFSHISKICNNKIKSIYKRKFKFKN